MTLAPFVISLDDPSKNGAYDLQRRAFRWFLFFYFCVICASRK